MEKWFDSAGKISFLPTARHWTLTCQPKVHVSEQVNDTWTNKSAFFSLTDNNSTRMAAIYQDFDESTTTYFFSTFQKVLKYSLRFLHKKFNLNWF